MKVLITGGAGFIGYHLAKKLLSLDGYDVTLLDNLNDYYDLNLKLNRLKDIQEVYSDRYKFVKIDLNDTEALDELFRSEGYEVVINLAAQAGVRYARENPGVYIKSNIDGFFNVVDIARKNGCELVIYASSSSVYGGNKKIPFEESDQCNSPLSVYASSKLADELIAESYKATFNLKYIGLRFFNVYGPWGRPDAVYFKWSDAITDQTKIDLRDNGEMYRDMTYINDVVKSIELLVKHGMTQVGGYHQVFNVGNENPVRTGDLLDYLVEKYGSEPGEIEVTTRGVEEPVITRASTAKLQDTIAYAPNTDFKTGIDSFVEWYKGYYNK